MGIRGLPRQKLELPFVGGVSSKPHPFALDPPKLAILRDAQFGQTGALRTRLPYATLGTNILGGGTIANPRRVAANGNEIVLFTSDTLYSWDSVDSKWVSRGAHLAVKVTETPRFETTGDQRVADRAELGGVVFYVWEDTDHCYLAAIDKTTGAVIYSPTVVGLTFATRPRLVALQTRVMLLFHNATDAAPASLVGYAIDPANIASSVAGAPTTILASPNFGVRYDATQIIGTDSVAIVSRRATTTSYSLIKVTSALAITATTKARTLDQVGAISSTPDGASLQIARTNAGNLQGDLVAVAGLADTFTNQAIAALGSTPTWIAAAHRSVQNGGQYRCYVFWDSTGPNQTNSNWVDTGNALGTAGTFNVFSTPASRAFDYNGSVYLWTVFAEANTTSWSQFGARLQNTFFLYRDDGSLASKACRFTAAGTPQWPGHLSGVALTSGSTTFSWAGSVRRLISLGAASVGYAQRAPRDVVFTFDSNDARRTVRLGNTLYITGGELLQYDGVSLSEVNFHVTPWAFLASALGSGGSVGAGTYGVKCTYRSENAAGEIERSTTTNVGQVTCVANDKIQMAAIGALNQTRKTSALSLPAVEVWRTAANPTSLSPFYLTTSKDPGVSSNPNRYLADNYGAANEPTFQDGLADSSLTGNENNPENGAILTDNAPPGATIIAANADRVFLAGVTGDPHRIWYSKLRAAGSVAAFNDALTITVPAAGGDITAMAFLNETLIVFRSGAIYALPGDGYDNAGNGQNFGPARIISLELGAQNADAIAYEPIYGLIFKTNKGWFRLDRGWNLTYIGAPVTFADSDTVNAINVVESQNQIRVLTNARMLVYNYVVDQWAEWTISTGVHAAVVSGTHYVVDATSGPQGEQTTYATANYGMDVELAWIKMSDLQGFARIRRIDILGEFRSNHTVQIRVARDYQGDGAGSWSWFDNVSASMTGTVGSALQIQHPPTRQQCQAVKVRITITPNGNGDCVTLVGLAMDVAVKPGVYNRLPVGQKL